MNADDHISQGRLEDILLRHRFLYYVEHAPSVTDAVYDTIERVARERFSVGIAHEVGSSNPADYPVYVREGRRPLPDERAARDARIARRWTEAAGL